MSDDHCSYYHGGAVAVGEVGRVAGPGFAGLYGVPESDFGGGD